MFIINSIIHGTPVTVILDYLKSLVKFQEVHVNIASPLAASVHIVPAVCCQQFLKLFVDPLKEDL